MTEISTAQPALERPARSILIAAALAAIIAAIANSIIAAAGHAAGAPASTNGLMPASFLSATVGAIVIGAFGWAGFVRFVSRSGLVLGILVPVILVVSLVPVIGMLAQATTRGDVTAAVSLGLLHLTTLGVAVPIYRRFLRRR